MTVSARFDAKYVVDASTGCWNWTAAASHGYGVFMSESGRAIRAHRWEWIRANGPVPAGLELDHLCRNTLCVNPAHLEPVTHRENMRRSLTPAAANVTKTHCIRGHALAGANVYEPPKRPGHRHCKACKRANDRRYSAAKVLS